MCYTCSNHLFVVQAHLHACNSVKDVIEECLAAVLPIYGDDLKTLAALEAVRKSNLTRIENALVTKVDQQSIVAMTGIYMDMLIAHYQFVVDLLRPISAQAVAGASRHLMYLKETSTVAVINRYGIVQATDLPAKLREKWVALMKEHFGDAALLASEVLGKDRKERLAYEAQLARDRQNREDNRELIKELAAQNAAQNGGNHGGKRRMAADSYDQPKKTKNINTYCKSEGLCIKYVRANCNPPLAVKEPCPGQDSCKFNHAMPSKEVMATLGLKSGL